MKNREKYRDEIIKPYGTNWCKDFVVPKILRPLGLECEVGRTCRQCHAMQAVWLEEEYEEPKVNWSKVAVDTPILVKNVMKDEWTKRYFAKYEDDMIYAWHSGCTSWSTDGVIGWVYGKLAEGEK